MERPFLRVEAMLSTLGVAAEAFGAHGLKDGVSPKMVNIFETKVR